MLNAIYAMNLGTMHRPAHIKPLNHATTVEDRAIYNARASKSKMTKNIGVDVRHSLLGEIRIFTWGRGSTRIK